MATTITISPLEAILEDAGDTVQLTATVEDQNGQAMTDVAVAWSSSDSIIANVSEDGLVTGEEAGSVTIQAWVGMRTVSVPAFVEVDSGPRTVLHKLYRVMGGDDWRNNTSWRTDAPLDQWHGVWINDQGNIHQLWLRENGLTGAIPPEVGRLTSLELLHLGINRVTGSIPPELGDLHNLGALYLDGNALTGPLPRELLGLRLTIFHWEDTDLCAPTDDEFQTWLNGIGEQVGNGECGSG